jgi:hypothetical protein
LKLRKDFLPIYQTRLSPHPDSLTVSMGILVSIIAVGCSIILISGGGGKKDFWGTKNE